MIKIIYTETAEKIKQNLLEDLTALQMVDDIFFKKRTEIIKMPKPGSYAVACLSGGMDSVANAAILMQEFGLKIFPFFINRGQTNYKWGKKIRKIFQ